jgi:hypothetical protein
MNRPHLSLVAVLTLAACAEPPTSHGVAAVPSTVLLSASPSTSHSTLPLNASVWVGCANGGAGESVQLSGSLRIHSFTLVDGDGGIHVRTQVQPDGVKGLGLATGTRYRGTGGTTEHEYEAEDGTPAEYSLINNFRIIGQGPGNNLLVHTNVHQTVNADGEVTASVNITSTECR